MTTYEEAQVERAPGWLQSLAGRAWNTGYGLMKDALLEAAKVAVKGRYASVADTAGLELSAIQARYAPTYRENASRLRARVRTIWRDAEESQTKIGLTHALEQAGYVGPVVRDQADDSSLAWWEFEVILFGPFPWFDDYLASGRWGDPGVYGDGGPWGYAVPRDEVDLLRAIVRRHTPRHARCRAILVVHAGETWDNDVGGTWDDFAETWGNDVTHIGAI